jgi:hypothetical protein
MELLVQAGASVNTEHRRADVQPAPGVDRR